jgi:hypothetical protein
MLTSLWNSSLNFLTALDPVTCAVIGIGIGIGVVTIIGVYFFLPSLKEQEEAKKKLIEEVETKIFIINTDVLDKINQTISSRHPVLAPLNSSNIFKDLLEKNLTNEILGILKKRIEEVWSIAEASPQYDIFRLIAFENVFLNDLLKIAKDHMESYFCRILVREIGKMNPDTISAYFISNLNSDGFYAFYKVIYREFFLIEQFSLTASLCLFFSFFVYILKIKFYQPSLVDLVSISFWFYMAKFIELVKQVLYYNRQKFSDYNIFLNLKKNFYFWKSNKLKSYYF